MKENRINTKLQSLLTGEKVEIKNRDLPSSIKFFKLLTTRYEEQSLLNYIARQTDIELSVIEAWSKHRLIASGSEKQILGCLKDINQNIISGTLTGLTPLAEPELQVHDTQVREVASEQQVTEAQRKELEKAIPGIPTQALTGNRGLLLPEKPSQVLWLLNKGNTKEQIIKLLKIDGKIYSSREHRLKRNLGLSGDRSTGIPDILKRARERGFLKE